MTGQPPRRASSIKITSGPPSPPGSPAPDSPRHSLRVQPKSGRVSEIVADIHHQADHQRRVWIKDDEEGCVPALVLGDYDLDKLDDHAKEDETITVRLDDGRVSLTYGIYQDSSIM